MTSSSLEHVVPFVGDNPPSLCFYLRGVLGHSSLTEVNCIIYALTCSKDWMKAIQLLTKGTEGFNHQLLTRTDAPRYRIDVQLSTDLTFLQSTSQSVRILIN